MKVCIAEKPSVAREIAQVLGAKTKKDGYFEGNGYQVTWTFGHFCTLREPEDYKPEWKRWSLYELPMVPEQFGIKLMQDKGVQKQFNIIKQLLDRATEVINCGDAGQEGEVIQRWVLTEAKYRKSFKRLWISSLTEEAIRQGFAALREGSEFDSLYQAGKSRAIGDWLLGMNATRLFTLKYAQGRQLLSLGRVQTPTLAMIVNRYHEIRNFKPEPYWELKTVYRQAIFASSTGKFTDQEKGRHILEAIQGQLLTITEIEIKKGVESPPRLFDLTSLQVECNNRLALSADETLKTVQSLYEKKVVTYPRVDTTFLPDDMYPKIGGILQNLGQYASLTEPLLGRKIRKSTKVFNNNKVTDHHAIIPTGGSAALGGTEARVFDIIARRFIAAFYPDCIVSNTTVTADVAGHTFRAKGRQILEPGWRVVYEKEAREPVPKEEGEGEEKEDNAVLPIFEKGEQGPHEPRLDQKMTSPPKDYTEATLLRAMETAGKQVDNEELKEALKENGIGRPSTRAAIIETLFRRQYIRKEKKKILPTQMGVDLIGLIQNPTLKSPEMTGQWEKKLRQIESGNFTAEAFLQELKQLVMEMVQEVKADKSTLHLAEPAAARPAAGKAAPVNAAPAKAAAAKASPAKAAASPGGALGACPVCKTGAIVKGSQAFGCTRWKENCLFRLPINFKGKTLTEKQVSTLLQKGKVAVKGLKDAAGAEAYDGLLKLDAGFQLVGEKTEKVEKAPAVLICPRCSQGQMLKGKSAFGCSRFREGCRFLVPFSIGGKALTDKQVEQLILKGRTTKIKGFTEEATGRKFDAALQLDREWKVVYYFD